LYQCAFRYKVSRQLAIWDNDPAFDNCVAMEKEILKIDGKTISLQDNTTVAVDGVNFLLSNFLEIMILMELRKKKEK
jgi:hypothetical protein